MCPRLPGQADLESVCCLYAVELRNFFCIRMKYNRNHVKKENNIEITTNSNQESFQKTSIERI